MAGSYVMDYPSVFLGGFMGYDESLPDEISFGRNPFRVFVEGSEETELDPLCENTLEIHSEEPTKVPSEEGLEPNERRW
jgi:hypothetical protein